MKLGIDKAVNRIKLKILGWLQIAAAYGIVYWVFRDTVRFDCSGIEDVKPPYIVLGNHTSFIDPALVQCAIAKYPCYFLTTNFYFRLPVIGKILSFFGAIPKTQFLPDIRSTRGALAVIARGDVVGIFPEGRRSIDGYGFLQPADSTCVVFDEPVKWAAWQRENMSEQVRDENFLMQALVTELRVADKFYGSFRSCGRGYVSLRREGLYFHGRVDGQTTDLFFPIERIPTVSTEFKRDFEICDDKYAWWIFLEEEQQTVQLESAISLLYQLNVGK